MIKMPGATGTEVSPMHTSLAQIPDSQRCHWWLPALLALAGCASLPPPTGEIGTAQQALAQAVGADADQYAPDLLARARGELEQAQTALAARRDEQARALALAAAADADLARERSQLAVLRASVAMRKDEIRALQQRLTAPTAAVPAAVPSAAPAAPSAADGAGP